ncbi:MAG: branched-chain amino acid ABC transporter permease [Sporichthyaceae bacterium]
MAKLLSVHLSSTKVLERGGFLVVAAGLALWPVFTSETAHFYGSLSAIYALVGLSLVILVGWTGQISLGHAAFLGFGCYIGEELLNEGFGDWPLLREVPGLDGGLPLVLVIPIVGLIGAAISLILGIPSLRLRGVYLTITTLAFGLACQRFFFTRPELRPTTAEEVPRESLVGISTETDRGLYYAVLAVLALALLLAYNTRRSDVGRVLFAIRDSEAAAQAMAIKIAPYKIGVFAASAALATIAGLFYGMLFRATPGPDQFGVLQSLFYLAMPVLGGAEALFGALIGGGFLATGQPLVNEFDVRIYLATAVVLLLVLLSGQDGVMGMLKTARIALTDAIRGEPLRYGSFLPADLEVTDPAAAPQLRARTSSAAMTGARVRLRIIATDRDLTRTSRERVGS